MAFTPRYLLLKKLLILYRAKPAQVSLLCLSLFPFCKQNPLHLWAVLAFLKTKLRAESGFFTKCLQGRRRRKKVASRTSVLQEQLTAKITMKMGYSWLHRMVSPLRKAWTFTFSKIRRNKTGGPGLWKLSSDVRSCSYEDVHVMWSILHKSQTFKAAPKKSRFSRMHQET